LLSTTLNLSLDEALALLNVLLQISNALGDEILLVLGGLTDREDLLNTVGAKLNVGGEELNTLVSVDRGLNEGRLNNALLALLSLEKAVSEASTSESHGKGGRASTVLQLRQRFNTDISCAFVLHHLTPLIYYLGLDDFVATELDTVGKSIKLFLGELLTSLGEKGNNGDTRVTTDDSDVDILGVLSLNFRDEAGSTDDVKGSDTEKTLGVIDTSLLEDLSEDRNSGVDRVGDDEEVSLGAVPMEKESFGLGSGPQETISNI
jgi:hypothetical protein